MAVGGEGGMVTTNNKELADYVKQVRHHGQKNGLMTELGYNWRMTEVSALMGITQLNRIEQFISRRTEISKIYDVELANLNYIDRLKPSTYLGPVLEVQAQGPHTDNDL